MEMNVAPSLWCSLHPGSYHDLISPHALKCALKHLTEEETVKNKQALKVSPVAEVSKLGALFLTW